MKRKHVSRLTALVVAALLPSAAMAVLTESSTTGFGDGADAFTQGSFATTNFGASGVLTTRNQTGNAANNYKVYLRFDLSGMTLDRSQASAVTLSFASITARTGTGFSFFALPDEMPGDLPGGWSESTIHYNNAPANAASTTDLGFLLSPAADESGNSAIPLGTMSGVTTGGGAVHSFSSTALTDLIKNDTNGLVTVMLRRTDIQGVLHLASAENTLGYQAPTLTITGPAFVSVPEPGTAAVGVALFAVALSRRRHR